MLSEDFISGLKSEADSLSGVDPNSRLKQSVVYGSEIAPDKAARVINQGAKTGLPEDYIEEHLDELEVETKKNDFNAEAYRKSSPVVAAWIARRANNAALALPEAGALGKLEPYFTLPESEWPLSPSQIESMAERMASVEGKYLTSGSTDQSGVPNSSMANTAQSGMDPDQAHNAAKSRILSEIKSEEEYVSGLSPVGFFEATRKAFRENPSTLIPFVSGADAASRSFSVYQAAKRMESGTASDLDNDLLLRYGRVAAAGQRRGENIPGMVSDILVNLPAFALEMAATSGAYNAAKLSFLASGKPAIQSLVGKAVGRALANKATRFGGWAVGAAAQSTIGGATRTIGSTIERMTPDGSVVVGSEGQESYVIDKGSGQTFPAALLKAWAGTFVEYGSERSGVLFEKMDKRLQTFLFNKWASKTPGATVELFRKALKAGHVQGVIGETLEEEIGKGMKAGLGVEDYRITTPEELAAQLIAFSAPGAVSASLSHLGSKRSAEDAIARAESFRSIGERLKVLDISSKSKPATTELVKEMVDAGPNGDIYIAKDVFDTYYQSQKNEEGAPVDPRDVVKQMLGSDQAYAESEVTGHIAIPADVYHTTIGQSEHGSFFSDHVKVNDPEALSGAEGKAVIESQANLKKEMQAEEDAAASAPDPLDQFEKDYAKKILEIGEGAGLIGTSKQYARDAASYFTNMLRGLTKSEDISGAEVLKEMPFSMEAAGESAPLTDEDKAFVSPAEEVLNQKTDPKKGVDNIKEPANISSEISWPKDTDAVSWKALAKQFYGEARTDVGTGLPNMRAFEEHQASPGKKIYSTLDVNVLKKLNDQLGQVGADKVLKNFADLLLQEQIRESNLKAYRTGGDEFTLVRDGAELEDSRYYTDRLVAFVDKQKFEIETIDKDGNTHTYVVAGIGLSYGTGESREQANAIEKSDKLRRIEQGTLEESRSTGPTRRVNLRENRVQGLGGETTERGAADNQTASYGETGTPTESGRGDGAKLLPAPKSSNPREAYLLDSPTGSAKTPFLGPDPLIRDQAEVYAVANGFPYRLQDGYVRVDIPRAERIVAEFVSAKHNPTDPEVIAAYDSLKNETKAQWDIMMRRDIKVEKIPKGSPNPYKNSNDMIKDVRANNHIWFFGTEDGFGTDTRFNDHPLYEDSDIFVGNTRMKYNDLFRVVHDYFGHAKEGNGFGAIGEENAWQSHVRMFSDLAARAMTTETRGQNSWVNYGPYGEANRADPDNTIYADQKAALLPEWVTTEGLAPDREMPERLYQAVYHGTPHKFDKFTMDHIGTGEGAQAYGWGLYFSGNKEVAKFYLRAGRDKGFSNMDSVPVLVEKAIAQAGGDKDKAKSILEKLSSETKSGNRRNNIAFAKRAIDRGDYNTSILTADIPEDSELLDRDAKLTDQPIAVQQRLRDAGLMDKSVLELMGERGKNVTGKDLYHFLEWSIREESGPQELQDLSESEGIENPAEAVSKYLLSVGIPGLRYLDGSSRGKGDGTHNYVIWDDSSIQMIERFYQADLSHVFYMQSREIINQKMGPKANKSDIRGMLKDLKLEEREFSGIDEFLEGEGQLTKQEVLAFIEANRVPLKETVYSDDYMADHQEEYDSLVEAEVSALVNERMEHLEEQNGLPSSYVEESASGVWNVISEGTFTGWEYDTEDEAQAKADKFNEETYAGARIDIRNDLDIGGIERDAEEAIEEKYGVTWSAHSTPGGTNHREIVLSIEGNKYVDTTHFPNVEGNIGWLRVNDRSDKEGHKVLHIDEVQSQLHQTGRDKGYYKHIKLPVFEFSDLVKSGNVPKEAHIVKNNDGLYRLYSSSANGSYIIATEKSTDKLNDLWDDMNELGPDSVPDAPFKKTWSKLLLKRIVRYAAENGYTKITWTPGERQAERYQQSNVVEYIEFDPRTNTLVALDKNGRKAVEKVVDPKDLHTYIGAEPAKKLLASEYNVENPYSKHRLDGVDLDIGGEGMKAFYDRQLVNEMNDIVKRYGSKVEKGEVSTKANFVPAHSVTLTPELIDHVVRKGFPMFQGDHLTPRGQITKQGKVYLAEMFKNADRSTPVHEPAHYFMDVLDFLAKRDTASDHIKTLHADMLKWLGAKSFKELNRGQKERFAEAAETYMMTGKAPTAELKPLFVRFKVWFTGIYKTIGRKLDLDPEVRDIFDRMMTGQDAATRAEQAQALEPMFKNAAMGGMTEAQFASYTKAKAEARQFAEEKITSGLLKKFRSSEKKIYAAKRAEVEKEVTEQVEAIPVYKAIEDLERNQTLDAPLKINALDVPAELKDRLPLKVMSSDGMGMHPNIIADIIGYESGTKLMNDLAVAVPKDKLVKDLTDQRMIEEYPDMLLDGTLPEESIKAVHNEKQAQMLRMELEHLAANNMPVLKAGIRRIARRPPPLEAVTKEAKAIIAKKTIKDIKPYVYQKAEIRYAREAGRLFTQGKLDEAFDSKLKELMNHELFKQAELAKEMVAESFKLFKRLAKPDADIAKRRDMDLVNAARAVLAEFGIGKKGKASAEYLEPMKQYDPDKYSTMVELVESSIAGADNYKLVPLDKFAEMSEVVESLWDIAAREKTVEIKGRRVAKEVAIARLSLQLSAVSTPKARGGYIKSASGWEIAANESLGWVALGKRTETWTQTMDQGKRGDFTEILWDTISAPQDQYDVARTEYYRKHNDIVQTLRPSLNFEPIYAPELVDRDGKVRIFKDDAELLGAMLHTGNPSNMSKLLRGYGWGEYNDKDDLDTSRWDTFVTRLQSEGRLTKAHYDYLQSVWNLMEEVKPAAWQAHKQKYGFYPSETVAEAFKTPFGEYKGGYYPASADTYLVSDAQIRSEKEQLENQNNSFMFPSPGRGFTKTRKEGYARPLVMDIRMVNSHIDKVLRFTILGPHINDVGRLLWDKGFRAQLDAYDKNVAPKILVPWLQRASQQLTTIPTSSKQFDNFFRYIRKSAGAQIMVGNLVNALQQFGGLSVALLKVGPKYMTSSLWKYKSGPSAMTERVKANSLFMKNQLEASIIDIQNQMNEIVLDKNNFEKAKTFANKHGYFFQRSFQNVVNTITHDAAFEEALSKNKGMSVEQASEIADSAVRTTQGGMRPIDMSNIEVQNALAQMFMMFYSYPNMWANALGSEYKMAYRDIGGKEGLSRAAFATLVAFTIPAVVGKLLIMLGTASPPEDDDGDGYLDEWLSWFFASQFESAASVAPVLGPFIRSAVNRFDNKAYNDNVSISAALTSMETVFNTPGDVYKYLRDGSGGKRAVKGVLTSAGLASGLPLGALGRSAGYAIDVKEGRAQPSGSLDYTRGLVAGK